jgi:hypothetical protein
MFVDLFFWVPDKLSECCANDDAKQRGVAVWLFAWQQSWSTIVAAFIAVAAAVVTILEMQKSAKYSRDRDDANRQTERVHNVMAHIAAVHHLEKGMVRWFDSVQAIHMPVGNQNSVALDDALKAQPKFPGGLDPSTGEFDFTGYSQGTASALHKFFQLHVSLGGQILEIQSAANPQQRVALKRKLYLKLLNDLRAHLAALHEIHKKKSYTLLDQLGSDYYKSHQLDEMMRDRSLS